jgi:hypothetical protein
LSIGRSQETRRGAWRLERHHTTTGIDEEGEFVMSQETLVAPEVKAEARMPGTVVVSLSEEQGDLYLFGWNDEFTGYEDFVALYKNSLPENPESDRVQWKYVKEFGPKWKTGEKWGSGWIAAYVAKDYRRGPSFRYVVQTAKT